MQTQLTLSVVLLVLAPPVVFGGEGGGVVESVWFETSVTPPVYVVPKRLKEGEPLFRAGLRTLPESVLVMGALAVGSGELGLSAKQAGSLAPLVKDAYAKIGADPAFRETPSALPFCFATEKQTTGHYFLYRPEEMPDNPVAIVFLHGYGGNFQFYTWVLKEEFPDAVILAPSWGVSWGDGSPKYVQDMLADARRRTSVGLDKPWLVAISAGGRGGFSIYNKLPAEFSGYVCLASLPGTFAVKRLRPDLKILMLNGTDDGMVPIRLARKQAELARRAVPTLRSQEIEGNHFFLLSNREETFGAIREFMRSE